MLAFPFIGNKGNDRAVAIRSERKAGFLERFPEDALFRTLLPFELAADADPFFMIQVVLLFHAVLHEVTTVFFNIAETGFDHLAVLSPNAARRKACSISIAHFRPNLNRIYA